MEIKNDRTDNIGVSAISSNNLCDTFTNSIHSNGTDNDIYDSLRTTRKFDTNMETNSTNIDKNDDNNHIGIYRYKFTNEFTNELFKFSKVHQYDHRKDFKDAWEKWIEENENIVEEEVRRLTNIGYDGDINDKMFKSARYYFRKKSTEKKAPAKRRIYVGSHKELLETMDEHIKKSLKSGDFKPSDGFDEYCRENIDILKEQVNMLCQGGLTDSNEIKGKIKKTYKNRYFLIISK